MAKSFEDWFSPLRAPSASAGLSQATTSLICFPYSGMGVAMFAPWRKQLPSDIEAYAVRLPGREDKLREPARTDLVSLADELAETIVQRDLSTGVALAGFSLGGVLAFEIARSMRRRGAEIVLLAAGAARAPQGPRESSQLHKLGEQEFLDQLDRRYGGVAWEALANEEMRRLVVPTLRCDIQMVETYVYRPEPPLNCEVLTLIGAEDRVVTPEQAALWQELAASYEIRFFPGGHFFARKHAAQVVQEIAQRIRSYA